MNLISFWIEKLVYNGRSKLKGFIGDNNRRTKRSD